MTEIHPHRRPKRALEARVQDITFNEALGEPGADENGECPVMEWERKGDSLFRNERKTTDGYYLDFDAPMMSRKTTVRKALLEAIRAWPRLYISGLTNQQIIRVLTHEDYFALVREWAENEDGYSVNGSITFHCEDGLMHWEQAGEYEADHLKYFPSQSPGGMYWHEECDDCLATGVDLMTEKKCRICRGVGFLRED